MHKNDTQKTPSAEQFQASFVFFCSFDCDKKCYGSKASRRQSGIATDLRSDVLRESLFLTVLHCKHTTGHASFGAACQATGIPSLFFFLLSLSILVSLPHIPAFSHRPMGEAGRTTTEPARIFCLAFLTWLYSLSSHFGVFLTQTQTFLCPPPKIVFWDYPKHWH